MMRVLLVDDNEVDRMLVRRLVKRSGIAARLDEAEDLTAARARLDADEYDVILLDHYLPDGEATDFLQVLPETAPPVVVLTGQGDERLAVRLIQAGAKDYLVKSELHAPGLARTLRLAHERHRAECLRREAEGALAEAHRAALEAARMKSEFLANMSHEIRTPMNGLLGMLTLLKDTRLDETQRAYLDDALASGEHLMALLNDILDLSKLEAGKLTLENLPFHPGEVLGHAVRMYAPAAHGKGVSLWLDLDPHMPRALSGDARRLQQMVCNLVNNAVKFTDRGEVLVRAGWGKGVLSVEVRDSGIGIDMAVRERIFQPFDQLDASVSRKHGGSGLGLSIVRHLVHLMEGEMGVESARGEGSRFRLRLPFEIEDATPLCQEGPPRTLSLYTPRPVVAETMERWARTRGWNVRIHDTPPDAPVEPFCLWDPWPRRDGEEPLWPSFPALVLLPMGWENEAFPHHLTVPCLFPECLHRLEEYQAAPPHAVPRVLVVEGDPDNARVVVEMLRKLGCHPHLLGSGDKVIENLIEEGPFDVVLLDCALPGRGGMEIARALRAWERIRQRPPIPLVALASHDATEIREACRRAGMDAFLAKPLRMKALEEALATWIRRPLPR